MYFSPNLGIYIRRLPFYFFLVQVLCLVVGVKVVTELWWFGLVSFLNQYVWLEWIGMGNGLKNESFEMHNGWGNEVSGVQVYVTVKEIHFLLLLLILEQNTIQPTHSHQPIASAQHNTATSSFLVLPYFIPNSLSNNIASQVSLFFSFRYLISTSGEKRRQSEKWKL